MHGQHQNVSDVAVIGGGAMGTALAALLAEGGARVALWVYEKDLVERIAEFVNVERRKPDEQ